MSFRSRLTALVAVPAFFAGCALGARSPDPISIHDFGTVYSLPAPGIVNVPGGLALAPLRAPPWSDDQSLRYRLAYVDPTEIRAYAHSQWVAPPGALIEQRLRRAIDQAVIQGVVDSGETKEARYLLRIRLERFEQVFEDLQNAFVEVQLHAVLFDRTRRIRVAERSFSARQRTATADAQGAVSAFANQSERVIEQMIEWLAGLKLEKEPTVHGTGSTSGQGVTPGRW